MAQKRTAAGVLGGSSPLETSGGVWGGGGRLPENVTQILLIGAGRSILLLTCCQPTADLVILIRVYWILIILIDFDLVLIDFD